MDMKVDWLRGQQTQNLIERDQLVDELEALTRNSFKATIGIIKLLRC